MQQKGVHWFPGHMQKALKQIEEKLKLIDVVVEIVDARVPLSSKNPFLERLIVNKKKLLVMSKSDLADLNKAQKFVEYYQNKGYICILSNLNKNNDISEIRRTIEFLGREKSEKYVAKGLKPQPIRAMIIGIPNVGKSTLINRLAKRSSASIANTPGHTKSQQWIKIEKQFELLDTPGILPPHYEDQNTAINLALIGSMKEQNVPTNTLLEKLFELLKANNLYNYVEKRYRIEIGENDQPYEILHSIGKTRGLITKGGDIDEDRVEYLLLKEFKEGLITKIVIDEVPR